MFFLNTAETKSIDEHLKITRRGHFCAYPKRLNAFERSTNSVSVQKKTVNYTRHMMSHEDFDLTQVKIPFIMNFKLLKKRIFK